MGTKRPFDEELQQFIKYSKHLDYGNKQALLAEDKPFHGASHNPRIPGEAGGMFFHIGQGLENKNVNTISDLADKGFETSAPLSLVTSISGEEDAGSGDGFCSSFFPEIFDFNLPRRQLIHFDDTYSSLLTCSPRKEVPLGSNHHADVPEFDSEVAKSCSKNDGNIFDNGSGETLVGVCVIPMPDYNLLAEGSEAVDDIMDCKCLDGGSIRCVQQHVKEARVKLRETLGHEKFFGLGIYEMGEEVALKWTEEEERLFHEVVYSNSVLLEKNFWEQLSIVFPSRTKKELISYYFNVFMLRRRAVQNRSKLLDIDSDNDEWQGNDRVPFRSTGEDEDFVVQVDHGDDSSSEESDDDDGIGNGDVLIGVADATENATEKDGGGEFDVREDSCTSFEGQQYVPGSHGPVDERSSAIQQNRVESEKEKPDGGLNSEYSLQPCEGKVWDVPYSTAPSKSVDLLPTCSMIEEIFGPSKNGKSTS